MLNNVNDARMEEDAAAEMRRFLDCLPARPALSPSGAPAAARAPRADEPSSSLSHEEIARFSATFSDGYFAVPFDSRKKAHG